MFNALLAETGAKKLKKNKKQQQQQQQVNKQTNKQTHTHTTNMDIYGPHAFESVPSK